MSGGWSDAVAASRRTYTPDDVDRLAEQYREWGTWGDDDELGSMNRITPDRLVQAMHEVRRGAVFSLSLPMDRSGPQTGHHPRTNPQHVMLRTPNERFQMAEGRQSGSDDAVYLPLQSSTQWDSLAHMFHDGLTYNGRGTETVSSRDGARVNSITSLKDRAVGRAVLLDLPRHLQCRWLEPGFAIQSEDLDKCAEAQGVEVREGDFLLVRTGQIAQCRDRGSWGDYAGGPAPGLGVASADFICGRKVAAVSTDTWGLEASPYEAPDVVAPLHVVLLVNAGIHIGEMWDLEELAEDCAADGVYSFLLVAQPLTITGAVGSPLNPLAIK